MVPLFPSSCATEETKMTKRTLFFFNHWWRKTVTLTQQAELQQSTQKNALHHLVKHCFLRANICCKSSYPLLLFLLPQTLSLSLCLQQSECLQSNSGTELAHKQPATEEAIVSGGSHAHWNSAGVKSLTFREDHLSGSENFGIPAGCALLTLMTSSGSSPSFTMCSLALPFLSLSLMSMARLEAFSFS